MFPSHSDRYAAYKESIRLIGSWINLANSHQCLQLEIVSALDQSVVVTAAEPFDQLGKLMNLEKERLV